MYGREPHSAAVAVGAPAAVAERPGPQRGEVDLGAVMDTLIQFRNLHDEGALTDREFELARAKLLGVRA